MSNDFAVRNALPVMGTEKMLGLDARVAEEIVVGDHGHEFFRWHGGPAGFADVGVVNEEGGCDDGAETSPVLEERGVSRRGPILEG